jgi:serine/threonine protein kinase
VSAHSRGSISSISGGAFSSETRALPSRSFDGGNPNNRTINFSDPTDFFLLQAKIGEGSYGAVYKALDYRDNKHVAIKVLQFHGKDSLKLRKEIHILKQCDSEHVVGYKGAFQKAGNVWIGQTTARDAARTRMRGHSSAVVAHTCLAVFPLPLRLFCVCVCVCVQ